MPDSKWDEYVKIVLDAAEVAVRCIPKSEAVSEAEAIAAAAAAEVEGYDDMKEIVVVLDENGRRTRVVEKGDGEEEKEEEVEKSEEELRKEEEERKERERKEDEWKTGMGKKLGGMFFVARGALHVHDKEISRKVTGLGLGSVMGVFEGVVPAGGVGAPVPVPVSTTGASGKGKEKEVVPTAAPASIPSSGPGRLTIPIEIEGMSTKVLAAVSGGGNGAKRRGWWEGENGWWVEREWEVVAIPERKRLFLFGGGKK